LPLALDAAPTPNRTQKARHERPRRANPQPGACTRRRRSSAVGTRPNTRPYTQPYTQSKPRPKPGRGAKPDRRRGGSAH